MATTLTSLRERGPASAGFGGPPRLTLAQMDLFAGLPERDMMMLESRMPMVRWPRGAEMPDTLNRPDTLHIIREGRLAVFECTAPGHEIMISLQDAGSVYSTLGSTPAASIAALEDTAISALPGRAVENLMARYPRLGRNLAEILSDRVAMLCETVALVSEMRVEDRLRARLHQLAERFGITTRDGVELRLELTHAQWASLVGASREAVTTAFSKLRANGTVEMEGRTVTIPWDVMRAHAEAAAEMIAARGQ